MSDCLTVGQLRAKLQGLPDDTPIYPGWSDYPSDDAPAVSLDGFYVSSRDGKPGLEVLVSLIYLDEYDEDEDEDDL